MRGDFGVVFGWFFGSFVVLLLLSIAIGLKSRAATMQNKKETFAVRIKVCLNGYGSTKCTEEI